MLAEEEPTESEQAEIPKKMTLIALAKKKKVTPPKKPVTKKQPEKNKSPA